MAVQTILSVGIDIGTSTTQVIFSRISMDNTAGYFSVPHISIVDKQVVYKSDIHLTPLKTQTLIDGEAVREIVAGEYSKACFAPNDVSTGAVIITGESARKENSEEVLRQLSGFAGEFVVSTAGPDLEAIIAGKGSGAVSYSDEYSATVVNLDIGGGTTNVVLFDCAESEAKGCVDIGGRLVRLTPDLTVTYISESAQKIAKYVRADVTQGKRTTLSDLKLLCDGMAALLEQLLGIGEKSSLLADIKTSGSSEFLPNRKIRAVCFSGGVADYVYGSKDDYLKFGDIGILLGEAIRKSKLFSEFKVIKATETIRATVVGAGTYTTSVSGSTIDYTEGLFPLKNIPVLRLSQAEQTACFDGDCEILRSRVSWFLSQSDSSMAVIALRGEPDPSFIQVKTLAKTISAVMDDLLTKGVPVIVFVDCDIAKALGKQMKSFLTDGRPVISIDSVKVAQNDFVDMGRPLMDGMVIPVVVKTLIFG